MCCVCVEYIIIRIFVTEHRVLFLKLFSENVQVERPYICKGVVAKGEEGKVG